VQNTWFWAFWWSIESESSDNHIPSILNFFKLSLSPSIS
jgi:hypothetical protein